MIRYAEYIKGEEKYRHMIAGAPIYGVLDSDAYYPVVPSFDADEPFDMAHTLRLDMKECKVYDRPGMEPITKSLYVEDWFAYDVEAVSDIIEE